jgi:hypothetical protein
VRRQAEAALEKAKSSAEAGVPALLNEACSNSNADVRLMAAVVLKKWIPSTWEKLSPEVRSGLKDSLMQASVFAEGVLFRSKIGNSSCVRAVLYNLYIKGVRSLQLKPVLILLAPVETNPSLTHATLIDAAHGAEFT